MYTDRRRLFVMVDFLAVPASFLASATFCKIYPAYQADIWTSLFTVSR